MLFRRIKTHVKAENWFAVGIDFLIVVVGVFIGIQVWNEALSNAAAILMFDLQNLGRECRLGTQATNELLIDRARTCLKPVFNRDEYTPVPEFIWTTRIRYYSQANAAFAGFVDHIRTGLANMQASGLERDRSLPAGTFRPIQDFGLSPFRQG